MEMVTVFDFNKAITNLWYRVALCRVVPLFFKNADGIF